MAEEKKIRGRASYRLWQGWWEFCNKIGLSFPQSQKVMEEVHSTLDGRNAYGSSTNAYASAESLGQLLKDKQMGF